MDNKHKPILFDNVDFQPLKGKNGLYPYVEHTESKICGFFGKTGFFLSNGQKCYIPDHENHNLIYPYSENAYQAAKFSSLSDREKFINIDFKSAIILAWELRFNIRQNWETVKIQEMKRVLELKFEDLDLRKKLIETGNKYLEETNHWNDTFWGVCNGVGYNHLGNILMEIRSNLGVT